MVVGTVPAHKNIYQVVERARDYLVQNDSSLTAANRETRRRWPVGLLKYENDVVGTIDLSGEPFGGSTISVKFTHLELLPENMREHEQNIAREMEDYLNKS